MSPTPLPEDGNIQFPKRCVLLCFLEYQMMENLKKTAILSVIHHSQNPLESKRGTVGGDDPVSIFLFFLIRKVC
jgi:hypothetical protein